jgi:3-deoxy-D-manno-octulosonic acid kinase
MNEVAAAGEEALARIAGGAMLYDASCLGQPDSAVFEPEHWRARGALEAQPGGRGSIAFVRTPAGQRWVLRHYHRGGQVARLLGDRYLWTGASRTRAFREWRLLRRLRDWGLRVPQPVAARYRLDGLTYRADLLTVELPVRLTLAQALRKGTLPGSRWTAIGRAIGALHAHGVQHADLNAHNLLLGGTDEEVYVLDFDRGRIRERGAWEHRVLARLRRSLEKVTADLPPDRFVESHWRALLAGAGARD